ncbi:FUSC family protein [Micromonospora globbae]|uniref:FUSC family protein n=1 Tax=Micromonospora globbae TaxID=1894969 RepID=A0A420EZ01_9ACTN|nr:FUSC family protein [Micromonospora globbae]RKF25477.1 FUSC family protein [Micromonospora globbae]
MLGSGLLARLRHVDPGYAALRRAARLTLVASTVFYIGRYGAGDVTLATYGLFGVVATGMFAQLPGSARHRARILLSALPVAWVLVVAGTLLAGNTAGAAAGMLVIGFAVAFAGVGGPHLVGLANAFQLFYILACFPPYQPETLPQRLVGVTASVALLAAAEVTIWPDATPVSYPRRLAEAADSVAAFLDATTAALTGPVSAQRDRDARHDQAAEAVARIRLAELPAPQRPTASRASDRALRACQAAMQGLLVKTARLAAERPPRPDPEAVRLLRTCADTTRAAGRTLRGGTPAVTVDDVDAATRATERAYPHAGSPAYLPRLCLDATVLSIAEQARILAVSARTAAGVPASDENRVASAYQQVFADARHGRWTLYRRQFQAHLTLGSPPFQTALRLSVALAAARVVAGVLSLMHGFWVLLATLTVLRTSAVDTRTALRPAVVGTVAGAIVSGLLLHFVGQLVIFAVALPVTMLLAFTLGRLAAPAWAQAAFTLVLTFVFAQLSSGGLQLAEVRLLDVLLGTAIGVLAGLLMWPRGARGDLRRHAAAALVASAEVLEEVVEATLGGPASDRTFERARRATILADASYAQYHGERPDPRTSRVDWQAVLAAGHHTLLAAESTLDRNPPGCLAGWPDAAAQLRGTVRRLRSAYDEVARRIAHGEPAHPTVTPTRCVDELEPIRPALDQPGRPVRHLVEVHLLLASAADDLARTGSGRDAGGDPGAVTGSEGP